MKLLLLALATLFLCPFAFCQNDSQELQHLVTNAVQTSALAGTAGHPFYLKVRASDIQKRDHDYDAQFELWWASDQKWRREIKSPLFSQLAIRNGDRYYEKNSAGYLPWWIYELSVIPLNPLPVDELSSIEPDMFGPPDKRCVRWNTPFGDGSSVISVHNSVCFDSSGRPVEVFSRTLSAHYYDYRSFEGLSFPRAWQLFDGRFTLVATVEKLEALRASDPFFDVQNNTGYAARLRFVSPPDSVFRDYTPLTSSFNWPVVHNFPASGTIAACGKVDRAGNLAVLDTIISPNVVLNDSAREQLKSAKFKPYIADGFPVQVNACFGIPFEARMEMYGDNSAGLPAEPFLVRILNSRQMSDLHLGGTPPFHRAASFRFVDGVSGMFEETWLAPDKWRLSISAKNVTVHLAQNGENLYRKVSGAEDTPKFLDDVLDDINGRFPRTDGSFIEADWGHSVVKWAGLDAVRVARGQVNERNEPINGQAYWFDAKGVLLGSFVSTRTARYTRLTAWDQKLLPYAIEISDKGQPLLSISIDKLELTTVEPDSAFVIAGVTPISLKHSENEPAFVLATPKVRIDPQPLVGRTGTVVILAHVDVHGHVADAQVQRSAGAALDSVSLAAVKRWEFSPMRIAGQPVPATVPITFHF